MIPVYIPSYGRANSIKTAPYLDEAGVPYTVFVHSEKDKDEYAGAGFVKEKDIVVTGAARGITNQRNWIAANYGRKGEWYLSLDDNIRKFNKLREPDYSKRKKVDVSSSEYGQKDFSHYVPADELIGLLESDIEVAETIRAEYIGFSTVDNYYFNSKKYRAVGYVTSKACLIKFDGLGYDPNLDAMEEFGFLADQLIKNGKVLINDWIHPKAGHYEPGGIGTYEDRVQPKIEDCAYLMNKYPNLFRYKVKKGCHPKAELQIRFHSPEQLKKWKQSNYIPSPTTIKWATDASLATRT